jgi:superfamily II DNA or RNA helicase
MAELRFEGGTLLLTGITRDDPHVPEVFRWDARAGAHRAEAIDYAPAVLALRARGLEADDQARAYSVLEHGSRVHREPRPYQTEALAALKRARGRGVVVLPTGAGKSHLAVMAIEAYRRSTLVVAPTLDLVRQWYDLLRQHFDVPVGVVGGGDFQVEPLTVTTYDSAHIHMEHLGARFGLVIFDECHHLPGESFSMAARFCLAPYRLGLTATPERQDGREVELGRLIGPLVYRRDIVEMSGEYLADYETERVEVELSPEEREEYQAERGVYLDFVRSHGISMKSPSGWNDFIQRSSVSREGRRAMKAYRRQRELAFCAPAKLDYVEHLLNEHRNDRCLLFTQDNRTAYTIARRFLVPVITHQTKVTERSEILEALAAGRVRAIATSKVLNEGVDVPDANVAIIVSGSGSVREHVQRLGRVLRKKGDKRAILYEIVTAGTSETYTSERRREHSAYR